jgi:uncharacterized membrane protein
VTTAPDDSRDTTEPVPFAGFRRNAGALAAGLAIVVALFWLVPDLAPPPSDEPLVELAHGRIVRMLPATETTTDPDVEVVIVEGPREGETLQAYLQGPSGQQDVPRYEVGDEVILNISAGDEAFVAVADRYRVPTLALLIGLFAAAVTLVGGWRGVRSLIALALTLGVVVKVVVPLILAGWEPAWVAIVAATGVTIATLLLTEGVRRQTLAAAIGTFLSLILVAALAVVFDELARFTQLRGSEDAAFLVSIGIKEIDLGGLVLAAIMFGALGILDDVTVTQAATVQELYEADPRTGRRNLAARAMNVGRSHIAATVNTLVLAYVGASLPLIVLFAAGGQEPVLIGSQEIVAVEVVRAIVGSIGIVAAVPLTTAIAVWLIGRRLPWVGQGTGVRHAPGWD